MLTVKEEKTLKSSEPESSRHAEPSMPIPFAGISCLAAEATITASQCIEDIVNAMKALWSEVSVVLLGGLDEYQVLLDFNFGEMQRKLADLIAGRQMQHLLKLGEQFGLIYQNDDEFDLDKFSDDGLYIQIAKDEQSRPLSLYVGLVSLFHTRSLEVDLIKFAEKAVMIKNNQRTYYAHSKEIWSDFKQARNNIKKNPAELPGIVAGFNDKWEGKVILSSNDKARQGKIKLQLKDTCGDLLGWETFEYVSTLMLHGFFAQAIAGLILDPVPVADPLLLGAVNKTS